MVEYAFVELEVLKFGVDIDVSDAVVDCVTQKCKELCRIRMLR